jgi:hypothetical protein
VRADDGTETNITSDDDTSWITQAANNVAQAANNVSQAASTVTPIVQAARSVIPVIPQPKTQNNNETTNQAKDTAGSNAPASTAVPDIYTPPGGNTSDGTQTTQNLAVDKPKNEEGFIQKTTTWVKDNPGKSVAIGAAVAGGSYLLIRSLKGGNHSSGQAMSGIPSTNKKRKKKRSATKSGNKKAHTVQKIKFTKLL